MDLNDVEKIEITSPDFEDFGRIPIINTGRGRDISPELRLGKVSDRSESIAVIMNDLDHPVKDYNHWVIWNIDPANVIAGNIPAGKIIKNMGNANQGKGYGKHRYRGPKPPRFMKKPHHYIFKVFVLDTKLNIDVNSRKWDLIKAMSGHVIQYGEITGIFGNDE